MSHIELFPVGIRAEKARKNFERRVRDQVSKSDYQKYTDRELGNQVRIWGYRDKGKGTWRQLSEGDYLLFYPGDLEYKYAARIAGTDQNTEFGNALFETPDEPFEYIVFLDSLHEISLDSEVLHKKYAGYKIGYPVKSQPFNDKAYEEILSRYDSVKAYIQTHLRDSTTSLTNGSSGSGETTVGSASADTQERSNDLSPPKKEYTVSRSIRNTAIAKELKQLYEHRCQVCGVRRERADSGYAEAHHIHPLGADPPGPDSKDNILVLCPNHHADFDYGMLSIDPDSLEISHQYDSSVDGNTLTMMPDHEIAQAYLNYHNENS